MIESVCEGAECWESWIAVSGLFQTIDSVSRAIFPFFASPFMAKHVGFLLCYDVIVCQFLSVLVHFFLYL